MSIIIVGYLNKKNFAWSQNLTAIARITFESFISDSFIIRLRILESLFSTLVKIIKFIILLLSK